MFSNKRTKIVCTIGPASEKLETIERMIKTGMNVARLNFSHGTYANHRAIIKNIRLASKKSDVPIAIIGDLQGPKVRVGELPKSGVELKIDSTIIFAAGANVMRDDLIPIPYVGLSKDLHPRDRILLDDGLLEVEVTKISGNKIYTKVKVGGLLTSHKGFNVPGATLRIPTVTPKDLKDLNFALNQNVDFVALSFVRRAKDVLDLRRRINVKKSNAKIIVKIEKHEAVTNFDEILKAADAIMIARGDLGIETLAEGVPLLQKQMIEKCLEVSKPVIVATQMLDSMIRNPRPTRAEVSDVANAVIDHTDAVMLSGETASGKYPIEAVTTMSKIIIKTESSPYDDLIVKKILDHFGSQTEAIGEAATLVSETPGVKLLAVSTTSGKTARLVSRFRPPLPIIAFTQDEKVMRQSALSWGVNAVKVKYAKNLESFLKTALDFLKNKKMVRPGQKIVIVAGDPPGKHGTTDLVKIITV